MTQMLLKVNLTKKEHLLSILNQINNTQLTMEKNQGRLPFFRYYEKKKKSVKKYLDGYLQLLSSNYDC